jgi:hypothetical protein
VTLQQKGKEISRDYHPDQGWQISLLDDHWCEMYNKSYNNQKRWFSADKTSHIFGSFISPSGQMLA